MNQHPLKEVAEYITKQIAEHERDAQIIEATVLEIARRKCCKAFKGEGNYNCLNCLYDCPFAGDKNYQRVLENAHKVVKALSLGIFDTDLDVINNCNNSACGKSVSQTDGSLHGKDNTPT